MLNQCDIYLLRFAMIKTPNKGNIFQNTDSSNTVPDGHTVYAKVHLGHHSTKAL